MNNWWIYTQISQFISRFKKSFNVNKTSKQGFVCMIFLSLIKKYLIYREHFDPNYVIDIEIMLKCNFIDILRNNNKILIIHD